MNTMHRIIEVEPLPGYTVRLKFEDGTEGSVDLSDLAGKGVFKAWLEPEKFNAVFIDPESRTIAWPGGIDLCPDTLYAEVSGKDVLSETVNA